MTTTATPPDRAGERGWVLLTAMTLLTIMTIVGLATLSIVDTQTKRGRQQRERESTLNLAEAALYQQGFKLAQKWPTVKDPAVDCSSASTATSCPAAAEVLANSTNVDTAKGATWSTVVRDNGGGMGTAFVPGSADAGQSGTNATTGAAYTCTGPCTYDANGDRKLWVRSQAVVRGRLRTIVATLKLETLAESVPQTAVSAGGINTGNNGSQVKIYAVGSSVIVKCDPSTSSGNKSDCISGTGIEPAPVQGASGNFMTPEQIARFKTRAMADGTYFPGCPPNGDVTGEVVFVDQCNSTGLNYNNTTDCVLPPKPAGGGNGLQAPCANGMTRPGLLIWHCGTIDDSGKGTFVGVLYMVNGSDGGCPATGSFATRGGTTVNCGGNSNNANNVYSATGGLGVLGALVIDGNGCLYAGSNGMQVQFDPNVFGSVASYGTVGLVQDTWRELIPS